MARVMADPRCTTLYIADYLPSTEVFYDAQSFKHGGPWFHQSTKFFVPNWGFCQSKMNSRNGDSTNRYPNNGVIAPISCEYAPERRNKGYALTVNDYPFNNVELVGGQWPKYVYPLSHPK